jgi:hypothetical protein
MKTCRHCGRVEPDNVYMCPACDRPMPIKWPSRLALQKIALAVLIPLFVYLLMTRFLGV